MRFPVERTNRTIKAILDKSVGEGWPRAPKGREVFVEEVDSSWKHTTKSNVLQPVHVVGADGSWSSAGSRGYAYPTEHQVVVVGRSDKAPSKRVVTIYVPQLDHIQMDVARDALVGGDRATAKMLLDPLGNYVGIALAILERQARTFKKAANPKKNTKQIRREVDDFLRSQGRL